MDLLYKDRAITLKLLDIQTVYCQHERQHDRKSGDALLHVLSKSVLTINNLYDDLSKERNA